MSFREIADLLFPTTAVVDCSSPVSAAGGESARTSYACTSSNLPVRLPITVLQLLLLLAATLIALLLYSVFVRVCRTRLDNALKQPPTERPLPVGRDVLSRALQQQVFEGFAAASLDFSPAEIVRARHVRTQARRGLNVE